MGREKKEIIVRLLEHLTLYKWAFLLLYSARVNQGMATGDMVFFLLGQASALEVTG